MHQQVNLEKAGLGTGSVLTMCSGNLPTMHLHMHEWVTLENTGLAWVADCVHLPGQP